MQGVEDNPRFDPEQLERWKDGITTYPHGAHCQSRFVTGPSRAQV